jgi:hypothetical protein
MSEEPGASFEQDVDDPEALRAAEDAVARDARAGRADRAGQRPIDGSWTTVAAQVVPGDSAGLEDVVRSLESDGIDFGWDPYDPRDAVNFLPPAIGFAARKCFSIMVPASQIARARESLYGEPPAGVTYTWLAPPAPGTSSGGSAGSEKDFGFGSADGHPRQVGPSGVPLSDNVRLERLAGGGLSIARGIAIVFVIVGVVAAVIGLASALGR